MIQARYTLPGATVLDAIAAAALRDPSAPAILCEAGTTTFEELVRTVDGYAAALLARDLRPGMPVGLVIGDGPPDFLLFLALLRLRAPILILSPQESPAERAAMMGLVRATACVGAAAHRPPDAPGWIDHEILDPHADPSALPPLPGPDDIAHFSRSSGTTLGQPKLTGITHGQRADRAVRDGSGGFIRGPADRILTIVSLSNVYGRSTPLAALVRGAAVVFPPAALTFGLLGGLLRAQGVTGIGITPPLVRDMLRHRGAGQLLPGIRLMVATAPLLPAERRQVRERLTPHLFINYSTNETGLLAIATPEDLDVDPNCAGRAVMGIEAEVVGEDLHPLPPGTLGELRFRDPGFPTAYTVTVPGQTSRFSDGWFYPGDAGSIDADGRITLHGRIDDVINVGGRKVHPSAIEAWLTADPRVAEAAALAVPEARLGQAPVGVVVLREPVAEEELLAICRRGAGAGIPMPKRVFELPELPRNQAGKVDRAALLAKIEPQVVGPRRMQR